MDLSFKGLYFLNTVSKFHFEIIDFIVELFLFSHVSRLKSGGHFLALSLLDLGVLKLLLLSLQLLSSSRFLLKPCSLHLLHLDELVLSLSQKLRAL